MQSNTLLDLKDKESEPYKKGFRHLTFINHLLKSVAYPSDIPYDIRNNVNLSCGFLSSMLYYTLKRKKVFKEAVDKVWIVNTNSLYKFLKTKLPQ